MNELVLADRAAEVRRLKARVLNSVSSPITKRYNLGLDEFFAWYGRSRAALCGFSGNGLEPVRSSYGVGLGRRVSTRYKACVPPVS